MKICQTCRARFKDKAEVCPYDGVPLVELPDPLVGRTLAGRYVVMARIGAGGFGAVYRARHEAIGRDLAVKFLAPELAADPTNRKRFLREAQAANRIGHENIISITDFGETEDGYVYLVMELLDGRSLSSEIERGALAPRRALSIALQVANAVARAHELDVIHRDLKPDNIYLLRRGGSADFVKILDFGLAHMKGEMKITKTGTVFGTPEYISPEQARGAPMTTAVDLYALGCVLYEMLTGELPFSGSTPDLILKHLREPPPRPSLKKSGLPSLVDDIVLRLLQKDPLKRHSDAHHLAEDLKRALELFPNESLPPRVSVAPSLTPASESMADWQTVSIEETWTQRIELFRLLLPRAYPRGDAPEWLVNAIAELAGPLEEMRALRKELDQLTAAAALAEERTRELRLRIGRALDELGRDESRAVRRLAEVQSRLSEAEERLVEMERPLVKAWSEIPPAPDGTARVSREAAQQLREIGSLSSAWIELERSLAAVRRDAQERERERDDLRFQISQLKGRLGTVDAEADLERTRLLERTTKRDEDVQERIEAIVRLAGPIGKHFMQFPELRPSLVGGAASAAVARS